MLLGKYSWRWHERGCGLIKRWLSPRRFKHWCVTHAHCRRVDWRLRSAHERREREGRDPHSPLEDVEDHQQEEREGEHEKDLVRELAPLQLAQRSLPHADAAPDASLLQHGVLERLPLRVQRAQRALRPLHLVGHDLPRPPERLGHVLRRLRPRPRREPAPPLHRRRLVEQRVPLRRLVLAAAVVHLDGELSQRVEQRGSLGAVLTHLLQHRLALRGPLALESGGTGFVRQSAVLSQRGTEADGGVVEGGRWEVSRRVQLGEAEQLA
mmetsp:Transcript_25841/g.59090  ORF Transcript_25841/g.59090 Transcript_25841/m.59090 type:complete len:267 (-) Transcript_25841:84-884(-)